MLLRIVLFPYFWLSLALLFMIVEILTPSFFFATLALAALFTGFLAFWSASFYVLAACFAISSFLIYFLLKPWYHECVLDRRAKTEQFGFTGLIGKTGLVTQKVEPGQNGYLKIDGDEWQACTADQIFELGSQAQVIKVEGNLVWIDEI
jgi:membrane protein implicated in regulation of membrane protease activity